MLSSVATATAAAVAVYGGKIPASVSKQHDREKKQLTLVQPLGGGGRSRVEVAPEASEPDHAAGEYMELCRRPKKRNKKKIPRTVR